MTPLARVLRTLLQVVVAVAIAVPGAVAMLGTDADTAAKIAGYAGACVALVSAVQNVLENATGKTLGAVPNSPAPPPPAAVPPAGVDPLV